MQPCKGIYNFNEDDLKVASNRITFIRQILLARIILPKQPLHPTN